MRLSSYLAVLAFLLFAAAAPAKPTFSCLPGFGGFFRPGDWTPINVVIENVPDSPADRPYTLEGELRVKTRPLQGDETVFVRRVAVTHQQKIKVVLYARISQDAACGAEFRTRNGRRLWEQDLKPDLTALRPEQRLIVVASDLSAPFSPRSATDLRGQRRAHVLPGLLPDLWVGYESVDLLVAPKDLSNDLPDPEQREALLSWVRFGGRLLAVGGVHYQSYQGSFLEPILPVKIAGSEEVALPAAGGESLRLLDATFDLKPQAAGLWRLGERPLAARWPVGRGEATFVGVDMDSAVARESAEARALWDSCVYAPGLGRRHSLADSMVFGGVDFAYGRAAELPSILLILVLLGCYTILVGPVNFYVLSKRRRLELAWITIPAIVAAFSVLTYAIGFTSKGGLLIMREMDVIQAGVDSADARLEKLVSLFSPRKRSYNLAFDSPRSAFCGVWEWADREHGIGARFVGAGGAVGGAGWPMAIDQSRRPIAIFDRLVAQWSSQSFGGLSAFDLGGRFEGEAVLREVDRKREMTVRLKNGAAFPLRDSTLLLGASAGAVGDLDPGESREFQIPLDDRKSAQGFAKDGMGSLATAFDPQMYGYRNAGGLNNPDDAENPQVVRDYLRAKVWQRFNEPPEGFAPPVTAPLRPRLVGWLDDPPKTLALNAQPDRQAHVAMVVVDLPLRVGPGSLWVNSDECVTELVDAQVAERGDFNVKPDGLVELADAEAVYACSPGFRDAAGVFRPTGQLLSLTASDQQLVAVSAFNFEQGGWETLAESYKNGNELALGARHASPIDGSVFLRVAVGRRNPNQPPDKPAQIRTVQVAFAGRAL